MHRAQRLLRRCSSAVLLLLSIPSLSLAATPWTLELTRGSIDDYVFRYQNFYIVPHDIDFSAARQSLGHVGYTALDVGWSLHRWFSAHVGVDYARYQERVVFSRTANEQMRNVQLRAHIVPIGLGVRFARSMPMPGALEPYVQVSPSLVLLHFTERVELFDVGPARTRLFVAEDGMTRVVPGFAATIGVRAPLHDRFYLTGSGRYLVSGGAGNVTLGDYSSGPFDGLNQTVWTVGIGLIP